MFPSAGERLSLPSAFIASLAIPGGGSGWLKNWSYCSAQDILAGEGVPVPDLAEGEIAERKKKAGKDKY